MAENETQSAAQADRWSIFVRDEEYNGIHPGLGLRFFNGEAQTEDEELAREAKKHAAFTVRKLKSAAVAEPKK